jgi:hypothetical protein
MYLIPIKEHFYLIFYFPKYLNIGGIAGAGRPTGQPACRATQPPQITGGKCFPDY